MNGAAVEAPSRAVMAALAAFAALVLAWAAGLFAPLVGVPLDEAGLPALALGAVVLIGVRRGRLGQTAALRAAAEALRRLDGRRLAVAYAFFVALVSLAAVRRYDAFEARAYDLAIFDQAVWSTSRGHFLFSSLKGDIVLLGDHASPILAVFAPLYWLAPDPRVLLVAQAALLGLGAFPVLSLARRAMGSRALAGLLPLAWLVGAPLRSLALRDFHPECIAVPALLGAIVALHARRYGWVALYAALAALCKETSALALVGLGVYAAVVLRRRGAGAIIAAAGLAVFAVDVLVVLPHFAGATTPYVGRYALLGSTLGEVLLSPVKRPLIVLAQLVWPTVKLESIARLLAPYGGLALFAPGALLAALPNYLANAMSGYAPMHGVKAQYHAELMAFVAAASVPGAAAALRRWPRASAQLCVLVATLALAQVGNPELARLHAAPVTARHQRIAARLAAIPESAAVAADTASATHLAHRLHLFHFPRRSAEANVVAVDTTVREHAWHVTEGWSARAELERLKRDGFESLEDDDGFVVLRRRGAPVTSPAAPNALEGFRP